MRVGALCAFLCTVLCSLANSWWASVDAKALVEGMARELENDCEAFGSAMEGPYLQGIISKYLESLKKPKK